MSSFFEPIPPRPPDPPRGWGAPAWDRPSEGTLPAIFPVGEIVGRNDEVVAEIEYLGVYPNGFTIHLVMLANPRSDTRLPDGVLTVGLGGAPHDPRSGFPRIGVRFADGRAAGRGGGPGLGRPADVDDAGFPTDPVLRMTGAGGGSRGFHYGVWVFPLPPDGPLEIFASIPKLGDDETSVVVDGSAVRAAAERAKVIWT